MEMFGLNAVPPVDTSVQMLSSSVNIFGKGGMWFNRKIADADEANANFNLLRSNIFLFLHLV